MFNPVSLVIALGKLFDPRAFLWLILMHKFETVLTINDIELSYGPFGYAHYFHPIKETWEMSASISNKKLEEMVIEQENINGEINS